MFEQLNSDNGITLDAATIFFILGWLPFIIAWGEYNTVLTEWLLQCYFVTIMVFINYPRHYERKNLRKLWFWKAMLVGLAVLHPAILAGMWFVDVSTKTKWHEGGTVLAVCAVALVVEFSFLYKIIKFFRPANS